MYADESTIELLRAALTVKEVWALGKDPKQRQKKQVQSDEEVDVPHQLVLGVIKRQGREYHFDRHQTEDDDEEHSVQGAFNQLSAIHQADKCSACKYSEDDANQGSDNLQVLQLDEKLAHG